MGQDLRPRTENSRGAEYAAERVEMASDWRLGLSKVEVLLGGAFGAAGEVEREVWVFGFDEELFDGAEELGGFFGEASGEEKAEDARVVVAEVDLLAVGEFDVEEMAEVSAEALERLVAGEEDAPALGPTLRDERFDERRLFRDSDQIRSEVSKLGALCTFEEGLEFFFGFVDDFENARLTGSIEQGVERLEILGEEILEARFCWSGDGGFRKRLRWRVGD
jgi:hypothetical protein